MIKPTQADRDAANRIRDMTQKGLEAQGYRVTRLETAPDDALTEILASHAEQARLQERERAALVVEADPIAASHVRTRIATAIRNGEAA